MNEVITRHDLSPGPDVEQFAEHLGESVARRIDKLEGSAETIDYAFSAANLAMRAHCVTDPRAAALETWKSTVNSMQLRSAIFALPGLGRGSWS
ncbi:hypothetical protein AB0393_18070 [Streptomyces cyaneofuscatus]|uniref:hypothetical protein n=1 Tax=Streptomyces TaxID=1883 RepID=UPI00344D8284